MERAIVSYHRDEANDWVAELDCHHNQHVRNNPPFVNRPWVEENYEYTVGEKIENTNPIKDNMAKIISTYFHH